MKKVANRDFGGFGWGIAHGAVRRRPPSYLDTIVLRTGGYTYGVGGWDSSIVQGPFSAAPCHAFKLRFATFASLYAAALGVGGIPKHGSAMPQPTQRSRAAPAKSTERTITDKS
jgi:hypothetical protein